MNVTAYLCLLIYIHLYFTEETADNKYITNETEAYIQTSQHTHKQTRRQQSNHIRKANSLN